MHGVTGRLLFRNKAQRRSQLAFRAVGWYFIHSVRSTLSHCEFFSFHEERTPEKIRRVRSEHLWSIYLDTNQWSPRITRESIPSTSNKKNAIDWWLTTRRRSRRKFGSMSIARANKIKATNAAEQLSSNTNACKTRVTLLFDIARCNRCTQSNGTVHF